MTHIVHFTPEAREQLDELENHIAGEGSPIVAARYVDSIVDYCESLRTFPHRGTRRDDLRPGLRTLGYRRRVTILFEVADDTVNIIGVYYGGQDYEAALRDDDVDPSESINDSSNGSSARLVFAQFDLDENCAGAKFGEFGGKVARQRAAAKDNRDRALLR